MITTKIRIYDIQTMLNNGAFFCKNGSIGVYFDGNLTKRGEILILEDLQYFNYAPQGIYDAYYDENTCGYIIYLHGRTIYLAGCGIRYCYEEIM